MSSRPARKRHSTTFYRDEQYNAPPSSARKSLPAKFMDGVEPSKIPEVLYAPDGRKFYPCKYCCKAFAFKKGQVSHIKACAYQSIEVSDDVPKTKTPVKQKALKVDVSASVFCLFINKLIVLFLADRDGESLDASEIRSGIHMSRVQTKEKQCENCKEERCRLFSDSVQTRQTRIRHHASAEARAPNTDFGTRERPRFRLSHPDQKRIKSTARNS